MHCLQMQKIWRTQRSWSTGVGASTNVQLVRMLLALGCQRLPCALAAESVLHLAILSWC